MSAKPNKQRRKRWCDSVLEAPEGYRQLLASLQARQDGSCAAHSSDPAAGPAHDSSQNSSRSPELLLLTKLEAFSSRPYHHGDMEPIKAITAAAEQLAASCPTDAPAWQHCMQAVLELLLMHSSRPLHKQLLSFVRKLPPAHQSVAGRVLLGLVTREATAVLLASTAQPGQHQQQWGLLDLPSSSPDNQQSGSPSAQQEQQQAGMASADAAAVLAAPAQLPAAAVSRGFDLAQAAISLLQVPAARAWLEPAGPLLLLSVARSIQTALNPQQQGLAQQTQAQHAEVQRVAEADQMQDQQQHHLTPKTVELVQDAINVMYMVLQYHGEYIAAAAAATAPPTETTAAGAGALALTSICEAAQSMLCALQGSLVVQAALASAAVVVWSAAILPAVPPTAAALVVAAGLTPAQLPPAVTAAAAGGSATAAAVVGSGGAAAQGISACAQKLLVDWRSSSLLEQQLALQGKSLATELQQAPAVARICALRGLLAAMPASALAGDLGLTADDGLQAHALPLVQQLAQANGTGSQEGTAAPSSGSSSSGCSFIMHCALPVALDAARTAPDAHFKFFAMSLLASVLEGAAQLWGTLEEQQLQAAAAADGPDAAEPAAAAAAAARGGSSADKLVLPWLSSTDAQAVMALLSTQLDEPVAQVLAKVQESFEALLALIKVQQESAVKLGLQPPHTSSSMGPAQTAGTASTVAAAAAGGVCVALDNEAFLRSTAQSVLALGAGRKGRYQPLTALLPHIGASTLLQLQPGLVAETIEAMQSNLSASAAAGFFKALLLQLRTETSASTTVDALDVPVGNLPAGPVLAAAGVPACAGIDPVQQHVPAAMQAWCRCWLPEVLNALWAQGERARTYVANYALPMVLQAEPLLLQPMVDLILAAHAADASPAGAAGGAAAAAAGAPGASAGSGTRDAAAALVVVLRTARRLQLVGDLDILLPQSRQEGVGLDSVALSASPAGLLLSAVSSATAALRTEALELVCVSARTTAPPGVLELLVAQRWLTLCLRCTGADSRHTSLALWEKLLARQAAAVRAIRHRAAVAHTPGATGGAHPKALPRASRSLLSGPAHSGGSAAAAEREAEAEQRQLTFLAWMSQTLLDSLYPGGPYERKFFALELMAVLLQQWLHTDDSMGTAGMPTRKGQRSKSSTLAATAATATAAAGANGAAAAPEPFLAGLLSPDCVQTLMGCVVDSWDKMRIAATRVLDLMPAALPGCENPQHLLPLLTWALQLLQSPRVRESDAGARTLQLLVSKYLVGLGWTLAVAPEPCAIAPDAAVAAGGSIPTASALVCLHGQQDGKDSSSSGSVAREQRVVQGAATFLCSLTSQLRTQLAAAHADMAAASRHGLMHGPILCLKYTVEVLPWTALASSSASISAPVSAAAAAACGLSGSSDGSSEVVVCGPASAVLHCWVTDLVGLLTAVADLVKPLLSAQDVNVAANEVEEADEDAFSDTELDEQPGSTAAAAPVSADAAAATGATGGMSGPAVQLLISACWTTYKEASLLIGTLAGRLPLPKAMSPTAVENGVGASSTSNSQRQQQRQQPQRPQQLIECAQLEQLGSLQLGMLLAMKHNGAVEKSQAGFIALLERLLESPEPCLNQLPRAWLNRCLARVQELGQCRDDIVRRSAGLPFAICALFLAESSGVHKQLLLYGLQQLLDIASNEDLPEPWPRVHAFNTLRVVFNDSNMAMDSSGYHAAGVVAAINGMTAPAWEVRNAAALTFTAILLRVVGARNIDTRQLKLLKPLNQLAATPAGLHIYNSSSGAGGSSGSGSPPIQGPIAVDFFARYPQLHTFLLQQLQSAVQQRQQQQQQQQRQQQQQQGLGAAGGSTDTVPPSLFPSLILLSRLRPQLLTSTQQVGTPGAEGADKSAAVAAAAAAAATTPAAGAAAPAAATAGSSPGLDPAVFVPAVLAVGQSPVMGVRSMAAAALAPLVPAEQLHAVCLLLADRLSAAAAAGSVSEGHAAQAGQQQGQQQVLLSQNALHGTLLQLTALLSAASNSSSDTSSNANSCAAAAALVLQLLPAFTASCSVFAPASSGNGRVCCAVRQAYIAAAGQLLVLAYKHWPLLMRQQSQAPAAAAAGPAVCVTSSSATGLLQQLISNLQSSCIIAVRGTVLPAAGEVTASSRSSSSSRDLQDPLYSCWLRDCTALLLGPLLQLQLLLHKSSPLTTYDTSNTAASASQPGTDAYADSATMAQQLQLLADLLPVALNSGLYEVRGAALKAAAVQLERMLAVCRQMQAAGHIALTTSTVSSSSSSATGAAAAVKVLASAVWAALQQQQVVKVTKRLLVVWGHIQTLQQLLPASVPHVKQYTQQQQQQQQDGSCGNACERLAAAATAALPGTRSLDVEQLYTLLMEADTCREPEARTHALLCAARTAHKLITPRQNPTASTIGGSSGTNDNGVTASRVKSAAAAAAAADVRYERVNVDVVMSLNGVTQLIKTFSEPHQAEQLRAAAAEALQLSGLLLPLAQGAAYLQVQYDTVDDAAAAGATPPTQVVAHMCANDTWPVSLSAWFLALRLMEDEEEDVRQAAAAAAQKALQLVPPAVLQPLLPVQQQEQQAPDIQPGIGSGGITEGVRAVGGRSGVAAALEAASTGASSGLQYVAAVQYSCFALLVWCASWCPEVQPYLVEHLTQLVFPADTAVPVVLQKQQLSQVHAQQHHQQEAQGDPAGAAGPVTPAGAATAKGGNAQAGMQQIRLPGVALRRLFEREADNHHEEPLLLAQHAAAALFCTLTHPAQPSAAHPDAKIAQVLSSQHQEQLDVVLSKWCAGVVQGFLPAVVDSLTASGAGIQRTGQGSAAADVLHPEVYVPLYRCCLGLWAVQPWLLQPGSGSTAVQVGQAHQAVVPSREQVLQAVLGSMGRLSAVQLPAGLSEAVLVAQHGAEIKGGVGGALFLLQ